MKKKLWRALGVLMLLLYLWFVAWYIYSFALQDRKADFETYFGFFMIIFFFVVFFVFAVSGLAGKQLTHRHPLLAGVLMLICGAMWAAVTSMFDLLWDPVVPFIFITAGVFTIASCEPLPPPR